jgi:hypothetical protein
MKRSPIMAFREELDVVYDSIIQPAFSEAGDVPVRVAHVPGSQVPQIFRRRKSRLIRPDVGDVDVHGDRLLNQVNRENEPRVRRVLADEPPNYAPEWPAHHFDHRPLVYERARVVLEVAGHQESQAFDLTLRNRSGFLSERDNIRDSSALENWQSFFRIEARKTVSGEERPLDALRAILPPADSRDRRQKRFNSLFDELIVYQLLMPRAGPDCKPVGS